MQWHHTEAAREVLASEYGALIHDWGGQVPVVLAYANSYAVGMSSLAVHALYRWLNDVPGIVCERAFASLGARPRRDAPVLTLESQRAIGEAAVIAWTLSFEPDYFAVVSILRRAGIPVTRAQRDETHPLLLMGGPAVSANPLPMSGVADAIVVGEIEPLLEELSAVLLDIWRAERDATLARMASLPGIYVPALHDGEDVHRQWLADLTCCPVSSSIVAPRASFGDMHLIELSRGCPWGCRFCLAGCWYGPRREQSLDVVLAEADRGLGRLDKVGLVASAVSDYTGIEELTQSLLERGAGISVSSLRVRPLPECLVSALARSGARSLTLAPEAGSERLRRDIHKGVGEEDILRGAGLAAEYGFESLKLYFMWGLPGETDKDVIEIATLVHRLFDVFPRNLIVNLTPFVPKPHTPFQREPMASEDDLTRRLGLLRDALPRSRVQLRSEGVGDARAQALLSRGDEWVASALAQGSVAGPRQLERALRRQNRDPERYRGAWDGPGALPWGFVVP